MYKRDTVVEGALQQLRHLVETKYGIGDKLPNERELSQQLAVSRGTLREVLGILALEGVVDRQWGVGTTVCSPRPMASLNMSNIESYRQRLELGGRIVALGDASCELALAPDSALKALRRDAGTAMWKVYRLFTVDGSPTAHMIEYIPTVIFGAPIDPRPMLQVKTSLYDLLNEQGVGPVEKTVTDVAATLVTGDTALALALSDGEPVIRAEQVTYNTRSEPLAHGISLQRTDLVPMRIIR
jgi:GntR family transcriptional regulator